MEKLIKPLGYYNKTDTSCWVYGRKDYDIVTKIKH